MFFRVSKALSLAAILYAPVVLAQNYGSGIPMLITPPPSGGGTAFEDLAPDGTTSVSGTACTTGNAHTTMDDDPDATPAEGARCNASTCEGSSASNIDIDLTLPTPTGNPTTGADRQTFKLRAQQCSAGSGTPSCALIVLDGASVHASGTQTNISATGDDGQLISFTWDATGLSNADGSTVGFRIDCNQGSGNPGNRRSVNIEAVEWVVEYNL